MLADRIRDRVDIVKAVHSGLVNVIREAPIHSPKTEVATAKWLHTSGPVVLRQALEMTRHSTTITGSLVQMGCSQELRDIMTWCPMNWLVMLTLSVPRSLPASGICNADAGMYYNAIYNETLLLSKK